MLVHPVSQVIQKGLSVIVHSPPPSSVSSECHSSLLIAVYRMNCPPHSHPLRPPHLCLTPDQILRQSRVLVQTNNRER